MSEMQKNKLLQKKVVPSKWFGTARNKEPTQQGRFFVFQKEYYILLIVD